MLTYLGIQNMAVIDQVELELEPGLTVVTGETGAGKSMLLSGLTLLLGARMSRDMLRTGETKLSVQAVWSGAAHSLAPLLDEDSLPDEVIIRRTASFTPNSKRDRLYVADRLTTLGAVAEVAPSLLSISSQHEYIHLLRRAEHVHILDSFAGHDDLVARMAQDFAAYVELKTTVDDIRARTDRRNLRCGQLEEILAELGEAEVQEGEEEILHRRIERLTHAVDISNALSFGMESLYESDAALMGGLGQVHRALAAIQRYEPDIHPLLKQLDGCTAELDDVVAGLRNLQGRIDVDPALLDHLQDRLSHLQKLGRRYGVENADALLTLMEEAQQELDALRETGTNLEQLEGELRARQTRLAELAGKLNQGRTKAARRLEKALGKVLAKLDMGKAVIDTRIDFDLAGISASGADHVEFLLSANSGEAPKPLARIASGGELSRVLLAFKAVLADAYPVPTYVFDEIDAGIGGKTALAVGRLLAGLGAKHQVICITHTPQLSAYADHHLVVAKEERQGKSRASVRVLTSEDERVAELARMLSGLEDSSTAISHARELLTAAQADKGRSRGQ